MTVIRSRRTSMNEKRRDGTNERYRGQGGALSSSPALDLKAASPAASLLGAAAAERVEEEQDQRDQQHVDRERLDQHQTEEQRAADVADRARVSRNRLDRGA